MLRIALLAGAVLLAASFSHPAAAQSAKALVGTWAPATAVITQANSRQKGTAAENQAVVAGSIAHYGRYTVEPNNATVTFHIQASTYANWDGQTQKRPFTVKGDQLTYRVPAPSVGAGSGELVWKRVKPQL